MRTGLWLGLLAAAQVFIGEELLADTAVAAAIIVAVLALSHPRVGPGRQGTGRRIAAGLGTAVAVAGVTCGYALWVQFRGPLSEHGSPWTVIVFHSYLYAFVTPSGALAFHTGSSAAAAAATPSRCPSTWRTWAGRCSPSRSWPRSSSGGTRGPPGGCDLRAAGAVLARRRPGEIPRDPLPGRAPAVALAAAPAGARQRAARPVFHSRRRSGSGPARLRAGPGARPGAVERSAPGPGSLRPLVVVLAVLPLVPLPLPVRPSRPPRPAGRPPSPGSGSPPTTTCWSSPTCSTACSGRPRPACPPPWSAEVTSSCPARAGRPPVISMSGCGPPSTSTTLWQGHRTIGHRPQAQIRKDLAYWQLAAIVTATSRDSRLARYLTSSSGRPRSASAMCSRGGCPGSLPYPVSYGLP